jgi:hypothetical protein
MRHNCARFMCRLAVAVGGLLTLAAFCGGAEGSLADCIDATCRITAADGSRGTGCAFETSQGYVFVLTAAHVVGTGRTVQCEFWRYGHQSVPLSAEVIARSESVDAAVACLPIGSFGGVLPACVPVAPRGYALSEGQTVTSVGCASGAWATGWKGHFLGYSGGSACFTPLPADGRIGSALFDAEGEKIVGLVWGRSDEQRKGYAVTVEDLYRALNFKRTASGWTHCPLAAASAEPAPTPDLAIAEGGRSAECGPDGCVGGYILPYRDRQQQRDEDLDQRLDQLGRELQRQGQVWPTMPPQTEPPQGGVPRAEGASREDTTPPADGSASGLGVGLVLAAAAALGVFLFHVVGKQ